ncbi:lysophospholipid acyltransferase family protein [Polyangium jinanense]|uniref:DUF374 domain-containing protein n=1 Tax=Polyangium jinanense TaxID=2829994 RepID=A0A9X4AWA6_9BACT|nr:DUF374 domain-containing protein [Polyangium jinanense]MDC3956986.1 DUF374 domain-containing protein [Polyangium jinanense]MDC3987143.1 DUF374 domain-containing protein [Polyangium jinanense]
MPRKPSTIYTVDSVPPHLRPLLRGYARVGSAALHGYLQVLLETCRIEVEGREILQELPSSICCFWHTWGVPGFLTILHTQRDRRFGALVHPWWPNAIWDVLGQKLGWRAVMASAGHGGAQGLDRVIECLKQGYSTMVAVDGPRGPLHRPKRGAFQMAVAARVPLLPMHVECDRALWLPRWDHMCLPVPSATIRVRYGPPIHVTEMTFAKAEAALSEALGRA